MQVYDYEQFEPEESYKVNSIFIKKSIMRSGKEEADDLDFWEMDFSDNDFMYFERLPTGYDEELYQYEYQLFVLTTFKLKKDYKIDNLYQLNKNEVIQVF